MFTTNERTVICIHRVPSERLEKAVYITVLFMQIILLPSKCLIFGQIAHFTEIILSIFKWPKRDLSISNFSPLKLKSLTDNSCVTSLFSI